MKKIDGVWYNDTEISKMNFEDFCATIPNKTKDFQKNIYFQITGKKAEIISEKKKSKKEITEVTEEGT